MNSRQSILIIEHDIEQNKPINSKVEELIRRNIIEANGIKIIGFNNTYEIENCMTELKPGVVIVNNSSNSFDALDVLKMISKSKQSNIDIFTIVVTESQNDSCDSNQLEYFKYDCIDVIEYPYQDEVFAARLRSHFIRACKYSDVLASTRTDPLTKLYNRGYITECIALEIARYQRTDNPFSLVMLDIDFFKKVNDTYGHPTGDIVLKGIANIVKNASRTTDNVCRYGGEEFLVILSDTNKEGAILFGEKIRSIISRTHFTSVTKEKITCTITVGIHQYDLSKSITDNINIVDGRLYSGKEAGRNCVMAGGETIV